MIGRKEDGKNRSHTITLHCRASTLNSEQWSSCGLEILQYSVFKKLDGQPVVTGPPFANSTSLSTFFVTIVVSIMKLEMVLVSTKKKIIFLYTPQFFGIFILNVSQTQIQQNKFKIMQKKNQNFKRSPLGKCQDSPQML